MDPSLTYDQPTLTAENLLQEYQKLLGVHNELHRQPVEYLKNKSLHDNLTMQLARQAELAQHVQRRRREDQTIRPGVSV